MKEEKTDRIKVSRTLRQRRSDGGQSEFADNRPNGIFPTVIGPVQRLDNNEEVLQERSEPPLQRFAENEDEPLQGKFEPILQKYKELADTTSERFIQESYAKSDAVTHFDHMKKGERFAKSDSKHFIEQSRDDAYQETKRQATNRITKEIEKENKKKHPDQGRLIQLKSENETGLPDHLKAGIEALSGYSLDGVRVHYDSDRPATVQALAYTQGTEIHVAPGQERHLPHEAWHVAQQMARRVQPTTEIDGVPINDSVELEREADAMGAKANDY